MVLIAVHAQTLQVAYFSNQSQLDNKYENDIQKSIDFHLANTDRMNVNEYIWNTTTNSVSFNDRFSKKEERPANYLLFSHINVDYENAPELKTTYDTLNNITSAHFVLSYHSTVTLKMVDTKTSQIVGFKTYEVKKVPQFGQGGEKLAVKDFSKYLGKTDKNLNKRAREEKIQAIQKAYSAEISNAYQNLLQSTKTPLELLAGDVVALLDDNTYKLASNNPLNEKEKTVDVVIPSNSPIYRNDELLIYSTTQHANKSVVALVGRGRIKDKTDSGGSLKLYSFGRKEVMEAIKEGKQLILARNKRVIEEKNTFKNIDYKVALDKDCLFCDTQLEQRLQDIHNISLIERAHEPVLRFFDQHYRDEQFMDCDLSDFQFQQEGVQFLIKTSSEAINITEVATSKMLSTSEKALYKGVVAKLLDISGETIDYLTTIKEKKNKTSTISVYHPFGLAAGEDFEIAEIIEENVGGKTVSRYETIAKGSCMTPYSKNVAELKITDGKKELYQALSSKTPIRIYPVTKK